MALIVDSDADVEDLIHDELNSIHNFVQKFKNFIAQYMPKLIKIFNAKEMQPITRMWISLRSLLSMPVSAADGEGVSPNINSLRRI